MSGCLTPHCRWLAPRGGCRVVFLEEPLWVSRTGAARIDCAGGGGGGGGGSISGGSGGGGVPGGAPSFFQPAAGRDVWHLWQNGRGEASEGGQAAECLATALYAVSTVSEKPVDGLRAVGGPGLDCLGCSTLGGARVGGGHRSPACADGTQLFTEPYSRKGIQSVKSASYFRS